MFVSALLVGAVFAAPASVDRPISGTPHPNDVAVVIGNEDYAFLPDVPYALNDASAIYETLLTTRGVPSHRVQLLKGANREQILGAIRRAANEVDSDGRLWVYFAGHGATTAAGGLMLVGDDAKADASAFEPRSVAVAEVESIIPPGSIVVVDACHAGVSRAGEQLLPDARFAVPTYASVPTDSFVWTAASPTEISVGYEGAEHGLFTYAVLGALRGWADGVMGDEADGDVTLAEAEVYVRRRVASVSRNQTPVLLGTGGKSFLLSSGDQLEVEPEVPRTPSAESVTNPATVTKKSTATKKPASEAWAWVEGGPAFPTAAEIILGRSTVRPAVGFGLAGLNFEKDKEFPSLASWMPTVSVALHFVSNGASERGSGVVGGVRGVVFLGQALECRSYSGSGCSDWDTFRPYGLFLSAGWHQAITGRLYGYARGGGGVLGIEEFKFAPEVAVGVGLAL
jgi:hypothetical protein